MIAGGIDHRIADDPSAFLQLHRGDLCAGKVETDHLVLDIGDVEGARLALEGLQQLLGAQMHTGPGQRVLAVGCGDADDVGQVEGRGALLEVTEDRAVTEVDAVTGAPLTTLKMVEDHRISSSGTLTENWLVRDVGRVTASLTTDFVRFITGDPSLTSTSQLGLTFEETLRHMVRQDPDVIVLGEIRDHFSAEAAIQAALKGQTYITPRIANEVLQNLMKRPGGLLVAGLCLATFATSGCGGRLPSNVSPDLAVAKAMRSDLEGGAGEGGGSSGPPRCTP